MAAVYAYSDLTIIAADGTNADAGLRGLNLRDESTIRNTKPVFDWPGGTQTVWPYHDGLRDTMWNTRGWTFQEYAFSTKRLIFVGQSMRWECRQSCFWEEHILEGIPVKYGRSEVRYDQGSSRICQAPQATVSVFPDLEAFQFLASEYIKRDFTKIEDTVDAFAGVMTSLNPIFVGGFLWGLPVIFLDICLLWNMADGPFRRRWNPRDPQDSPKRSKSAPIWSWMAWQGEMNVDAAWTNADFVRQSGKMLVGSLYNKHPALSRIVSREGQRWSLRHSRDSPRRDIEHQNEWHEYKRTFLGSCESDPLPPGWTRHAVGAERGGHLPQFYYTHESVRDTLFAYPVSVPPNDGGNNKESHTELCTKPYTNPIDYGARYLCKSTHRAFFDLKPFPDRYLASYYLIAPIYKYDKLSQCDYGHLWILDQELIKILDENIGSGTNRGLPETFDLVAVSMRHGTIDQLEREFPLGEEEPQWYNLLLVEWVDGVAYRQGMGQVRIEVWDAELKVQENTKVELILG